MVLCFHKRNGWRFRFKYAASSIIYLGKRKEKDGTEVVGNIIHCKNYKSRLTKENAQIDVRLTYKQGLDKYYGLLELGEQAGVFKKVSTRYEMPDGSKVFGKSINTEPEKYFTKEVLERLMNTPKENSPTDQTKNKRYVFAQRKEDDFSCIKLLGSDMSIIYKYNQVKFSTTENADDVKSDL